MSDRIRVAKVLVDQLAAQNDLWFLETICLREMQRMAAGEVHTDTLRAGGLLLAVRFERTEDGLRVTEGEVAEVQGG